MKKLTLSITLLLLLFTLPSLHAQDLKYGLKAGLNIASLNWSDDDFSTSSRLGAHFGGFVNYKLKEKLALHSELFYSTGGGKWETDNNEGEVKIAYITLPVLVQYDVIENLYLEGGLQYNFLLSNKEAVGDDDDFDDLTDNFKSGTFGFAIGAAYRLDTLLPGLIAGIRYTADITELNDIDVNAGDYKTSMIQLSFLYTLSK